jgi:hypothetical protein
VPNTLAVIPRPQPRPDSAALAAAWGLTRPGDVARAWARRQVEKIRVAWGAGRLQFPPFWDNYTEETPEIREAYLPMLREPMVKAPYSLSVAGVAALECQVIPARPDDERHKQAAAAFKAVLSRVGRGNKNGRACGTRLVASEILSGARIAGWSLCELVPAPAPYRWDGPARGKEYWLDIKSKDTRRLTPLVDEFKNVVAVRSFAAGARTWEGRDLDSFVTYAHWPLYCSPTGTSDFRAVYRACWIKNVAWQLRAVGFDRFTHPYFQATYGDITQKAAIEEALQDARSEGYIVLPPGATATAVDLAMKSDEIFHSGIQDLDREILIGISWSHLPIQEGQTQGGRGDTKVQQATADLKLYDDAASLAGVVQGQMADPWYERNFADVEPGTVVWGAVQEKDLKVEADVDDVFVNRLGGKLSLQEAYKRYGRTPPKGPDDVLGGAPKPPPGQGGPPGFPPQPPGGGGGSPFGGEGPDAQFCGGPGSGVPGPCPGPDRGLDHVVARARANAAARRVWVAGMRHARKGTEHTKAALDAATAEHAALHAHADAAEAGARAAGATRFARGHAAPKGRASRAARPPEPGFTGTDSLGRRWVNGKLVAKEKEAGDGRDGPGGGAVGGEPAAAGGQVAGAPGGPGAGGTGPGGDGGDKSAGAGPAGRVPASPEEVNKRLDRYADFFRRKGQHQVADWMEQLRDHVNEVGTEEALKSLGEEAAGRGEDVLYGGGWDSMGSFAEQYLSRNGIALATPSFVSGEVESGKRLVSSLAPSGEGVASRGRESDVFPVNPTLANKLEEAKSLPGLEKSEDINKLMGKQVENFTPDVVAKLDDEYGKGRWIVKSYGEEAYAGYGIYFPQRVAQLQQDAKGAIWSSGQELARYGFEHLRDDSGKVIGIRHAGGDEYRFGTEKYDNTIQGAAREAADRAATSSPHEQGAAFPPGSFMAQPAFAAVGVSDADRAAGRTIAPGEGRVHVVTRDGRAEVVPHSTWIKGEPLPVVFESDDTRAMARAAVLAVNALPESERRGQLYAPDLIKTPDGYRAVEANPANEAGASGYLGDNPFIIDSYVSHLTGRDPAHVRFIRDLLTSKK